MRYEILRIDVKTVAGSDVLAGSSKGIADLGVLVRQIPTSTEPIVVALDFARIRVATSSYLREFLIGFRNFTIRTRPEVFPVIANANSEVIEELHSLLVSLRDALAACDFRNSNQISNGRVIGVLDEKERIALAAVLKTPGADAVSLADAPGTTESVSPNAWNNRLAGLVEKRFLVEERDGRKKRFTSVLKELKYGR
jgi:hypothetical protein